MGKEIERKWLWNYSIDFNTFCSKLPATIIKDYYFNNFCRLRFMEDLNKERSWTLTIKTQGTHIRDEYEFPIDKKDIVFIPTPMLCKTRYYFDFEKYTFEINVFRNIGINAMPLVLVELELPTPFTVLNKLPNFCGDEVTNRTEFYGYNLYNYISAAQQNQKSVKGKVVNITEFIDKKKKS